MAETPRAKPSKRPGMITDIGEKIGGARKDTSVKTGSRPKRAKPDADAGPAWARKFMALQSVKDGRWYLYERPKASARFLGRPLTPTGFATEAEAQRMVPLAAVSQQHRVRPVLGTTADGKTDYANPKGYEIWRNVSDRKRVRVVKEVFPTEDAARRYMANNAAKIVETKTAFGEEVLAKPEKVYRTGDQFRKGNVKPDVFHKEIGFRGVEFGNWQGERQQVLGHAYDAMRDLARVTGVHPESLSLNRDLALAFGARGQGIHGARAHYEQNYGAINLTKLAGAGALAHEWWHALDHLLGRIDDPRLDERNVKPDGTKTFKQVGDAALASNRIGQPVRSNLPAPVKDAYKDLITTIYHRPEAYTEDASKVQRFMDETAKELDGKLSRLRQHLAEKLPYGQRNVKPATVEQLARFDALAARLKADGATVTWKGMPSEKPARSRFGGMNYRYTNDTLEEMSKVMKEVRGRSGFDTQHRRGPLDDLGQTLARHTDRVKKVQDAAAQTVKTRMIPTEYAREAQKLDEGRVSDYWRTKHEMTARAFSAYVEDKLSARGHRSDYLSFGSQNVFYPELPGKPFPEGPERDTINKKFDRLFSAMREANILKPDLPPVLPKALEKKPGEPKRSRAKAAAAKTAAFLAPAAIMTAMLAAANEAKAEGKSELGAAATEGARTAGPLAGLAGGTTAATGRPL